MVGELEVAIAGHSATFHFLNDHILLSIGNYTTARAILKTPMPDLSLAGKLLSFSEIALLSRVGKRKPFELFPQPSWIVRLLSPAVRGMFDASVR